MQPLLVEDEQPSDIILPLRYMKRQPGFGHDADDVAGDDSKNDGGSYGSRTLTASSVDSRGDGDDEDNYNNNNNDDDDDDDEDD